MGYDHSSLLHSASEYRSYQRYCTFEVLAYMYPPNMMFTRNAQLTMVGLGMLLLPQLATAHTITATDVGDFPACAVPKCMMPLVFGIKVGCDVRDVAPTMNCCRTCKTYLEKLQSKSPKEPQDEPFQKHWDNFSHHSKNMRELRDYGKRGS